MKDWNFSSLARQIWGEEEDYLEMKQGRERISYVFSLFPDLIKKKGCFEDLRSEIKRLLSPCAECVIDLIPEETAYHSFSMGRDIREGELITLDCTLKMETCWVDMAKTWAVGSVSCERENLLKDAERVFYGALGLSRPGSPFSKVCREIERILEESPCRLVPDCGGHGIGRAIHQGQDYIYSTKDSGLFHPTEGAYTVEPVIALDTEEKTLYAYFEETLVCGF
ncbi:MAG: M24 family metallopeptidase [Spirochaetales bacterium]|nr:M24 family metallopeptidase [Spirochaetales bacterium]